MNGSLTNYTYSITVSRDGEHVFAVDPTSIPTRNDYDKTIRLIASKFTKKDGFFIVGREIYTDHTLLFDNHD